MIDIVSAGNNHITEDYGIGGTTTLQDRESEESLRICGSLCRIRMHTLGRWRGTCTMTQSTVGGNLNWGRRQQCAWVRPSSFVSFYACDQRVEANPLGKATEGWLP
jgi:hypothetical protein